MRFKEMSIALFMTILFLCLPITQAVSCDEVNKIYTNVSAVSSFKVKLTEEQLLSFNDFINSIPSVEDQNIAKSIADQILSEDKGIDIDRFGEILREYGFENVSSYQETTDIVDDVLNFIMELIIERLGWVYDLLEKTTNVLSDAQRLWEDKSLPREIITEIGLLIENLNELQNLATLLTEGKYVQFLRAWSIGIIIEDIKEIIQSIEIIASDFGILTGDISRFISETSNFMNWLSGNPWEQPIRVYGKVIESTKGLSNVTIRCRGMTSTTDAEGNFSFFVNSTPDDHSIPPDVYYGIHQCIITAENNGTLKETPVEFSYVFSDGGIYWLFLMDDDDSVYKGNTQNVGLHRMGLWSWICSKNVNNIFRRYIIERYWAWLTPDII
jgi:hypothetical protein